MPRHQKIPRPSTEGRIPQLRLRHRRIFLPRQKSNLRRQLRLVPSHANGSAFEIFIEEEDNGLSFNIQNNARYELSKKELSGVTFLDPPQGDASEEHPFASAIKKIAAAPRTTIPVSALQPLDPTSTCVAYNYKD